MNAWLNQHRQALALVFSRFQANLLGTSMIALAIGVTLCLPIILYIALNHLGNLAGDMKNQSHMSVFLKLDHSESATKTIKTTLSNNQAVRSFKFVSKDEALQQMEASGANQDVITTLGNNPLPDAFFVEPASLDENAMNQLKEALSKLDGVAEVQLDNAWVKRLNYLLALGNKAVFVLATLLGITLLAVIGNTVRMQILTQQDEIEVSRLFGATTGFIRRPFLYAGALYGLLGGFAALLFSVGVILLFNQSITPLAEEYHTQFSLAFPNLMVCLITCLIATFIGIFSAYLAVSKSLLHPKV